MTSHGRELPLFIVGWTAIVFVPGMILASLLSAIGVREDIAERLSNLLGQTCAFLWLAGAMAILATAEPTRKRPPRPRGWDGEDDEE